jgi:hypothetical protein
MFPILKMTSVKTAHPVGSAHPDKTFAISVQVPHFPGGDAIFYIQVIEQELPTGLAIRQTDQQEREKNWPERHKWFDDQFIKIQFILQAVGYGFVNGEYETANGEAIRQSTVGPKDCGLLRSSPQSDSDSI